MALASIGRRAFLALSATPFLYGQNGKGATFVFAPQPFMDPATEFDLFRLTDPQSSAFLPPPNLHCISRRGRFLVHCSDRAGSLQAYRLDWHTGQARQLTSAAALDPSTVALSLDDRTVLYFDGPSLKQLTVGNLRERTVAEVASGWARAAGVSVTADGSTAVWVEAQAGRSRIRAVQTARGEARTVIEVPGPVMSPLLRPGRPQVAYRSGNALRMVDLEGRGDITLPTLAEQTAGQALWSPSGEALLYLAIPADKKQITTLREILVDQGKERLVAKTSQFESFGINGDSSVFVGASRSLASPYILLLLRSVRRELTLCEHRSSDASAVNPMFSPDSQNVFFTSDRRGKRCIYRAHVEKFVEETGDEPAGEPQ